MGRVNTQPLLISICRRKILNLRLLTNIFLRVEKYRENESSQNLKFGIISNLTTLTNDKVNVRIAKLNRPKMS